jgi:hypothetical protein
MILKSILIINFKINENQTIQSKFGGLYKRRRKQTKRSKFLAKPNLIGGKPK